MTRNALDARNIACEQALCLGKKITRKGKGKVGREAFSLFPLPSSPLDQRPVDRLRGIMRPMRWTRQRQTVLFRYSPSLSLKTLDTGISLLAVFKREVEMDYPTEPSLCTVAPSPTDTPNGHPFSDFFLRGGGGRFMGFYVNAFLSI